MPSSVRPSRDSSQRIRVAPEELTIVDWPLMQRPVASALAVILAAGASLLAGWTTGNQAVGLLVAMALASTLWRTWLPVQYELGASGVAQSVFGWRRRVPWTAVARYEVRSDGVLLVPDAAITPLAPLRGLYLHWGGRRDEVLSLVDFYRQSWNPAPRSSSHEPTNPQRQRG